MGAWAVALRVARRDARRHPWRSLLVMALVAIPVAGMVVATTYIRTDDRTALEQWDDEYGTADLIVPAIPDEAGIDGAELDALLDSADVSSTVIRRTYGGFRTAGETARNEVVLLDLDHPLWADRYDLTDGSGAGRAPRSADEIALSTRLADRLGVHAGETLELVHPDVDLQVTAVVEDRECILCDAIYGPLTDDTPLVTAFGGTFDLRVVDLGEPTAEQLQPALFAGADVRPLPELAEFTSDGDRTGAIAWSVVIGALTLAVVGIVIAAAFAAGARGQLTTLGILSASGASTSVLRRTLVLQGTVTGMLGTVLGFAVAVTGLVLGDGLAELAFNRRVDGYEFGLTELLAIAVVGVVGASVAALVPSRTVAEVPTLVALAGRRPQPPVAVGFTMRGIVAMVLGLACLVVAASGANGGTAGGVFAVVAIAGGCGMLFGAAALTPALVDRIEPLAGRSRGAARLAGRGLARNRVRSGAIIAAVAAAGALAVGGTATARATEAYDWGYVRLADGVVQLSSVTYRDDTSPELGTPPERVTDAIAGVLSDPEVLRPDILGVEVEVTGTGYGYQGREALVVDDTLAAALGLSAAARDGLAADGVVLLSYSEESTGRVSVRLGDDDGGRPADLVYSPNGTFVADGLLVSPEVADLLGAPRTPGPVFVHDRDGITEVERFDLDLISGRSGDTSTSAIAELDPQTQADIQIEYGFDVDRFDRSLVELALAALSVLFALLVVGIGLALAAADDRTERRQLATVGAGPSLLARVSGIQAAMLAACGFLLAVPVGYLPALVVISTLDGQRDLDFPFDTVAVLLLLVPALAYLGATAVTAVAQRIRPLQISTATFE